MLALHAFLLTLALADDQNPPDMSQRDAPVTFKDRVSLVTVPVVVRDKRGHAIGNLTREDFTLLDNGKIQDITQFKMQRASERAIQGARAALSGSPSPAGEVRSKRFVAYFFDDEHIGIGGLAPFRKAAIGSIGKTSSPGDRIAVLSASGRGGVDFTDDRTQIIEGLNTIQPGHPAIGMDETQRMQILLAALENVVHRMESLAGERIIVLTSPGFILYDANRIVNFTDEKDAIVNAAVRAQIIINTVDPSGVGPKGNDALAEMADDTGGTFFHNNNDMDEAVRRAADAPEFQYVLGFSPQNLRYNGAIHNIKVVAKNKDLLVQARRGYSAPKHEMTDEEQAAAELREALFSADELIGIPCELQTQFFKASPGDAKLSVLAQIDLHTLRFKKESGRNLNTLVLVAGVFSRGGVLIQGITKTVDLHVEDALLSRRLEEGISAKTTFDVPPGQYMVRLVVRDSEGQLMSARNTMVDIP